VVAFTCLSVASGSSDAGTVGLNCGDIKGTGSPTEDAAVNMTIDNTPRVIICGAGPVGTQAIARWLIVRSLCRVETLSRGRSVFGFGESIRTC
jgi:hypothetical protein